MYIGKRRGSGRDSNGVRHEWTKGSEVDAPKGDFDNIDSLEWKGKKAASKKDDADDESADSGKPTKSNTKEEIKAYLDEEGIDYDADALKDELLELV